MRRDDAALGPPSREGHEDRVGPVRGPAETPLRRVFRLDDAAASRVDAVRGCDQVGGELFIVVEVEIRKPVSEVEPRLRSRIRIIAMVAGASGPVEGNDLEPADLAESIDEPAANSNVVDDDRWPSTLGGLVPGDPEDPSGSFHQVVLAVSRSYPDP